MACKILAKSSLMLLFLLIMVANNLLSTFAASGGRMGGSDFYSSSSDSVSSSSRSSYSSHTDTVCYYDRRGDYEVESQGVKGDHENEQKHRSDRSVVVVWAGVVGVFALLVYFSIREQRASVVKVQVGLLGKARSLQRDLNGIANAADTSTRKGFHCLLTETALALLRHPDYFISGFSSVIPKWRIEDVEKLFNQLSFEERQKFDVETLVNVDAFQAQRTCISKASKLSKDYIVVTMMVAAKGPHKLLPIKNVDDLKETLQYLSSLNIKDTLAVEVLWTPQNEDDTLSEDEFLEQYPLLRPI